MPVLPGDSPCEALPVQFPLPFVTDNSKDLARGGDCCRLSFLHPRGQIRRCHGFRVSLSRLQDELAGVSHLATAEPVVLTSNGSF